MFLFTKNDIRKFFFIRNNESCIVYQVDNTKELNKVFFFIVLSLI